MLGTSNQIQWAEQIKPRIHAEFDRVAQALRGAAHPEQCDRIDAILTILEEKRAEVLAHDDAGYFIHDWQEVTDQVRQMVTRDPRYREIRNFIRSPIRSLMTQITVRLTVKELELLSKLGKDQLFRREFIDTKFPGHKSDPVELTCGKQLIERLRSLTEEAKRASRNGIAA